MTSRIRRITAVLGIYLAFLLVATVALPFITPTPTVRADVYGALANFVLKGQPSGKAYVADDTNIAILVKYVGTSTSGKVAVAAGGDLTFTSGVEGSEAAESTFECPVSGGLGGVIDVSDSACNTLGEVVDTINGSCTGCSSTNWRAVIVDGLRSDSSNDTIVTISATAATAAGGLALNTDTDVAFTDTLALTTCRDMTCGYITPRGNSAPALVENPWKGSRSVLWQSIYTSTYGSGTSTFQIFDVCNIKNKVGTNGSETSTQRYSTAGGATTVAATFDFSTFGFFGSNDCKLLIRLNNSAAAASIAASNFGTTYPYQ